MNTNRFTTDSMPAISRRLRALRHVHGLSQQEMADELGLPKNTWAGYESGKSRIKLDSAVLVYRRFLVDPMWIYIGLEANVPTDLLRKLNRQLVKDDDKDDDMNQNGCAA